MWPVFLLLFKLLPVQSLYIVFVSPDIPAALHGHHRSFSSAAQLTHSTAVDSQPDRKTCSGFCHVPLEADDAVTPEQVQHAVRAAGIPTQALSAADQAETSAVEAVANSNQPAEASTAGISSDTCQQHECHLQMHHAAEDRSHAGAENAFQPANASPCMHLSFWKGLYHDIAMQLTGEYGKPNLAFGANAGEQLCRLHPAHTHLLTQVVAAGHANALCKLLCVQHL